MTFASLVVKVSKMDRILEVSVFALLAVALLSLDMHVLTFLLDTLGENQATEVLQAALLQ